MELIDGNAQQQDYLRKVDFIERRFKSKRLAFGVSIVRKLVEPPWLPINIEAIWNALS